MTTEAASRSPTLEELLRMAIDNELQDVNVSLPGKIDKFDSKTQKATVKPLVQRLQAAEDGSEILEALPSIPGVPVIFPRGGGFYLTFPVKAGDFCHIVFCSRAIDRYKSGSGNDASPEDFRIHDMTDAVAYMGLPPFSESIKDFETGGAVLGKENGTQVHVADGKIELGGKGSIEQLSIDSKIQQQFAQISAAIAILAASDVIPHQYLAPLIPIAPVPTIPPPPTVAPYSPTPTNSALVTIEK